MLSIAEAFLLNGRSFLLICTYDKNGVRKRRFENINYFLTVEERLNAANDLRRQLETGLKKPPKPTTSIIYQHLSPYLTKHCELLRIASARYYNTCLTAFDEWLCNNGYKAIHPKKFTKKEAKE